MTICFAYFLPTSIIIVARGNIQDIQKTSLYVTEFTLSFLYKFILNKRFFFSILEFLENSLLAGHRMTANHSRSIVCCLHKKQLDTFLFIFH